MSTADSPWASDRTGQVYGCWEALHPTGRRDANQAVHWAMRAVCCGRVRTMGGKALSSAMREGRLCSSCKPRTASRIHERGERSVGTPEHEERVRRYTEAVDMLRARGLLGVS